MKQLFEKWLMVRGQNRFMKVLFKNFTLSIHRLIGHFFESCYNFYMQLYMEFNKHIISSINYFLEDRGCWFWRHVIVLLTDSEMS